MNRRSLPFFLAVIAILSGWPAAGPSGPASPSAVLIAGAMRNVMREGRLEGILDLDSLAPKENLFGLGPLEYLRGELLLENGRCYQSKAVEGGAAMKVEVSCRAKAPFFVYARVPRWKAHPLPDSVTTLRGLEAYLDESTLGRPRPFAFRLEGRVDSARIHVVNLPPGSKVASPADAHRGQADFWLQDRPCRMVGFFSTTHQGVFTHHDSFLHVHLITGDKALMGHLDDASFGRNRPTLFLPE